MLSALLGWLWPPKDGGEVSIQDNRSGRRFQFGLSGGRVDASVVEKVVGVAPVVWRDKRGIFHCLEQTHNGLSRQVFRAGEVIDLWVEEDAPPSRSIQVLDLDHTDLSPDLIADIFRVFKVAVPLVYNWSELQSDEEAKIEASCSTYTDAQVMLLKRRPGDTDDWECDWDDRYDAAEHQKIMSLIKSWINLPRDSSFAWASQQERILERSFLNDFSIKNKSDEVLVETSLGVRGAVLGLDIVKRLTWKGWCRSHLNYLLLAFTSQLPYIQLYTDGKSGGMAFVCRGALGEFSLPWKIVFQSLDDVRDFLRCFGETLPKSLADFSQEQLIEFKYTDDPPRAVFPYPGCRCLVRPPRPPPEID